MKKSILIVVLSLVAGFAVGAWSTSIPESGDPDPADSALAMGSEGAASAEERLAALERMISAERDARLEK